MRRRRVWFLGLAGVVTAVVCGAGLWLSPLGALPQQRIALERWRSQGVRHYRVTVSMSYGWQANGPWTLEVRDNRVVAGVDTQTGEPLRRGQLYIAQSFVPVDVVFKRIERDLVFYTTPRVTLVRVFPMLREWLEPCAPPPPRIAYHPTMGYPSGVTSQGSSCFPYDQWTVQVTELAAIE